MAVTLHRDHSLGGSTLYMHAYMTITVTKNTEMYRNTNKWATLTYINNKMENLSKPLAKADTKTE